MSNLSIRVIVLAAGKGTRMKSALPKVLHRLGGKTLLGHGLSAAAELNPASITVVIGHGADAVRAEFEDQSALQWAVQAEQLGTGHAVQQGLHGVDAGDTVIITYGDVPLIRSETLGALARKAADGDVALLTVTLENPFGYGRVIRDNSGKLQRIVEQKDASEVEQQIREVNTGVLAIPGGLLRELLGRIGNDNSQGEYYLTDIFGLAVQSGHRVETLETFDAWEVEGVNSRSQLATLERIYQHNIAEALMSAGVTLRDPARIDVRGRLTAGTDVEIDVNCVFEGDCTLAENVTIGPHCVLRNVTIGPGTVVQAHTVIEDAVIGADCQIGPFARLRPGTSLSTQVRIGNFVETKNVQISEGAKVNHLSYIGDAAVGKNTNIGAGTITCNYDGANKHHTEIGEDVFVGSNTALVAPVTLQSGSTIGAGSTIVREAPADQLTITRARQRTFRHWRRPTKNKS